MKNIISIVLTGGPCAGKSEGLKELDKFLSYLGYKVVLIPEIATETRSNGLMHLDGTITKEEFQKIIFETQLFKENLYREMLQNSKITSDIILIQDRGLMDTKIYLSPEEFNELKQSHGLTDEKILHRYTAVFNLESVANKYEGLYNTTTNKFRFSTPEQARKQENMGIDAWKEHPNFHIIHAEKDFESKIQRLKEEVLNVISKEKNKSSRENAELKDEMIL